MAGMISDSNYEDDEYPIPRVDVVSSLLFSDKKKDVVIFGEGNFTFSIALAAARNTYFMERLQISLGTFECDLSKSFDELIDACLKHTHNFWEGITVTYEDAEEDIYFDLAKRTNLYEIRKLKKAKANASLFDLNSKIISAIPSPPSHTIRYGVNATTTADPSLTTKDVIWFQCPWMNPPCEFIKDFMVNMEQESSQYLLIGIVKHQKYVDSYMKDLGIFDKDCIIHGYYFLGGDTTAIGKLLHLGYRYEGLSDIHDDIFDHHVTLVFKKL